MRTSGELSAELGSQDVVRRRSTFERFIRFAVVGLSGLVVNQFALWLFTDKLGVYYLASAVLATQVSTTWNFLWVELIVFPGAGSGRLKRYLWWALLNNAWLVARIPFLYLLTDVVGINYLWSNAIVLAAATITRFRVADGKIWPQDSLAKEGAFPAFSYDIHGIVRIASEAPLPELSRFQVQRLDQDPDMIITIGREGFGNPRLRVKVQEGEDSITYIEHLGRFGFAMRVDLGSPVRVQVAPLLRRSPHVLYTNVVEPLLRWEMVRRGRILIHAACLSIGGRGVLITARTDTGKTTTCLKSIKQDGSGFISDDMVIGEREGRVFSFPKPLTISAHTLKAMRGAPLSRRRRIWLQVQSRLHSKSGRSAGLAMSGHNLPIATMNALVQYFVPPPKFQVDELVPGAELVSSLDVQHLVVIERGSARMELLDAETAFEVLTENTEDAYGFPPYPLISQALANGEAQLEADIRRDFLKGMRATRLVTPDRSWFDALPGIVGVAAPQLPQAANTAET